MGSALRVANSSARHIARRVVLAMEQDGAWRLVASSAGSLQFERRWRPGRYLRLVERHERAEILIHDEADCHVVTIHGSLDSDRRVAVEAAATGSSIAEAVLEAREGTYAVFPDVFAGGPATALSAPRLRPLSPKREAGVKPASSPKLSATDSQSQMAPGGARGLVTEVPGADRLENARAPEPVPQSILRLADGSRIALNAPTNLGRDPGPAAGGHACALGERDMSVSRTHALFEPRIGGVAVTDLGSSNGTYVLTNGQESPLAPSTPVLVANGTVILLGDLQILVEAG